MEEMFDTAAFMVAITVVGFSGFFPVEADRLWRSFRPATRGAVYLVIGSMAIRAIGKGLFSDPSLHGQDVEWAISLSNMLFVPAIGLLIADGVYLLNRRMHYRPRVVAGRDAQRH